MNHAQLRSPAVAQRKPSAVRELYVRGATRSYTSLHEIISELTQAEILAALRFEVSTRRRRSIINRLISRGAALAAAEYVTYTLKEIRWRDK